ncbi:hypothetical protein HK101_005439 [Irineochytrium annulatum]|nr:hypothetical protein HK101_005439 [Irineochytrium annulatum]
MASHAMAQSCQGIPDGNIVCSGSANNTFQICAGGAAQPGIQTCAAPLVCCGNSCVSSSTASCYPPITSSCAGVADYKTVCTSLNTFNYCLGGKLYASTPNQSCAPGTVCCANSGLCDYPSNCMSQVSNPVVASPSVSPSVAATANIAQGSCAGVADYKTTCISSNTFNYCLGGGFYPGSGPQPCPSGTVCCANSGLCDWASNCKATAPGPSGSPAPSGSSVYVQPQTSCQGVSDGGIVCSGGGTYNVCQGQKVIASNMPCAPGTVCCSTTNRCDFASNCPAAGIYPGAVAPSAPVSTGSCANVPNGFKICSADQWSIFTCMNGYITSTETCLYGNKCCPGTTTCAAPGSCGATTYTNGNPCSGLSPNTVVCSNKNTFVICDQTGWPAAGSITCQAGLFWVVPGT